MFIVLYRYSNISYLEFLRVHTFIWKLVCLTQSAVEPEFDTGESKLYFLVVEYFRYHQRHKKHRHDVYKDNVDVEIIKAKFFSNKQHKF